MKFSCIIVDDEYRNIELLKGYVSKDPELTLVGQFTNPWEGLDIANQLNPDIIFLDIDLPGLNGVEFIEKTISTARVILTTALLSNIKLGGKASVAGYLLKPFPFERFEKCVSEVKKIIALAEQ